MAICGSFFKGNIKPIRFMDRLSVAAVDAGERSSIENMIGLKNQEMAGNHFDMV
jgi:hypothetical protein